MSDHQHDREPNQIVMWVPPSEDGIHRVICVARCSCGPGPYYYVAADSADKAELEAMVPDLSAKASKAYLAFEDPEIV